jgi:hypothetical protein
MLGLTAAIIAYCFPVLGAGFISVNAHGWDATRCPVQLQTTRLGNAYRHVIRRCTNSSPASLRHLALAHGPPAPKAEQANPDMKSLKTSLMDVGQTFPLRVNRLGLPEGGFFNDEVFDPRF